MLIEENVKLSTFYPTDPFAILEPQYPSIDVFEIFKASETTDFEALQLVKASVGYPQNLPRIAYLR